jgi:hypothetical protein
LRGRGPEGPQLMRLLLYGGDPWVPLRVSDTVVLVMDFRNELTPDIPEIEVVLGDSGLHCRFRWSSIDVMVRPPPQSWMPGRKHTGDSMPPTQKYLVFLRSVPGKQEPPSPLQTQDMYAAFNAWKEKFKANIVDMGGKLKPGGKILSASGVTDGPFAEAKEIVGGYMVVAAENYDRALDVARECPGVVRPGSSVEIREIASS